MRLNAFYRRLFLVLAQLPMPGYWRQYLLRCAGIRFRIPRGERPRVFIGAGVCFDSLYPNLIEIGNWTSITTGVVILTHFMDTAAPAPGFRFVSGKIKIGRAVFIGAHSILCKPMTIGDDAVIAAGSVVVSDIPSGEIWGGNPAHFIKKRNYDTNGSPSR